MTTQTMVVALAGILGTVISGIVGPHLAGRREDRRQRHALEHQVLMADRQALRELLQEAVERLDAADRAREEVDGYFREGYYERSLDAAAAYTALQERESDLWPLDYRMITLLGLRDPLKLSPTRTQPWIGVWAVSARP